MSRTTNTGFNTLLVDLGDVLCNWDMNRITALTPKDIRSVMNSQVWYDLERGKINTDEAYELAGITLGLDPQLIEEAFDQAQSSLTINWEFLRVLESLKNNIPDLQIFIASNISEEHFKFIQQKPIAWSIFTSVFTSSKIGMRKPDLCFYRHIVDTIGCDTARTIFIDNKGENLCAARSLGMFTVLAKKGEFPATYRRLQNLLSDPVSRGWAFLAANAGRHDSVIDNRDISYKDNFSQLLILGLTGAPSLIYLKWPSGQFQPPSEFADQPSSPTSNSAIENCKDVFSEGLESLGKRNAPILWNYFCDQHALTGRSFPPDADTTSIAYLTLPKDSLKLANVDAVLDTMLQNMNSDDLMEVYFVRGRPRTCPIVSCNILRLFHRFGRGADPRIATTRKWVMQCLETRACNYGTRFYSSPECFLYFMALWYKECNSADIRSTLRQPLSDALSERLHVAVNPLALGMRVYASQIMGISPKLVKPDFERLLEFQEADGGWPAGHFCSFGTTGDNVGNRGLTTALALKALDGYANSTYTDVEQ